jgi:outer membrane protein insertion porin family/translocation and assembly module TamA
VRAGLEAAIVGLPGGIGEIFDVERYQQAKRILAARLAERSFVDAQILGGAEVDVEARIARIHWRVRTGPFVQVGPIQITGLERVDARIVQRELSFATGDPLRPGALEQDQGRLAELQLFRSVVIRPEAASPQPAPRPRVQRPVQVAVVERPPRTLGAGVGYGTDDKLRGRVEWQRRNLAGRAQRLELEARASSLVQGLEGRLVVPRVLGTRTWFQLDASAVRDSPEAFTSDSLSASAWLARTLPGDWRGRVGYHLQASRVRDVSEAADLELDEQPAGTFVLSYLAAGLERSRLDDRVEPRRGTRWDLGAELSLDALGSDFDYTLVRAELRHFWPIESTVLAARLHVAVIQPFGRTRADEIPLVRRLFSGGGSSVRGYEYQHLGPLDDQRKPLGGTSLFEASVELRFPIWKQLSGVVFLDAGQVALDPFRLKLSELQYAIGPGLRFRTRVGPARLDWGIALNPPDGLAHTRLHLSVGHAF